MMLSADTIRQITTGAVNIEEKEDGLHFYKCTEKQINAWLAQGKELHRGANTTTGIRLDFSTNSKTLRFQLASAGKYELFVDGLLNKQYLFAEDSCKEIAYNSDTDGIHRITLHLPSHSAGVVKAVEIDDGAWVRHWEYKCRMLFLGDSITQGWDSVYDTNSYAYRVSHFFDADSVINGIGGAYYHTDTFDTIPFDPDMVIIAYGTNDSPEQLRLQAPAYLDLIQAAYPDKKIVVISPIWRCSPDGSPADSAFYAKCAFIEEEASKRKFHLIRGLELVPPVVEFFADGFLHPNDIGFAVYAENLCKRLLPLMQ